MQKKKNIFEAYLFLLTVILLVSSSTTLFAENLEDLIFLESSYENVSGEKACTFFSGHVGTVNGAIPGTPDGKIILSQASIGTPTPGTVGWVSVNENPDPDDPEDAAEDLIAQADIFLKSVKTKFDNFYASPDGTQYDPEKIYLNYDYELTSGDNTSDFLYDEEASDDAKEALYRALRINNSDTIKQKILDITYYQTAALIMQGNLNLEKAFNVRFQQFGKRDNDIENELQYLGWNYLNHDGFTGSREGAWYNFHEASRLWLDLFSSPIQRQYLIELSKQRSLSQTANEVFNGTAPSGWEGTWPPVVYDGYKDLATMMKAMSQRAKVVNEVAKRLVLLQKRDEASDLVEEYVQQFSLEEGVIMSVFFAGGIPEDTENNVPFSEAYPGLAESFLQYREAITQLSMTRELADNSNMNALGFDRDIVPILPGSVDNSNLETTFDYRMSKLINIAGKALGILATSETQDTKATDAKKSYEIKLVDFLSQMDGISDQYDRELIAIAGSTSQGDPNLESPETGGGLLDQQIENIKLAENNVQRVIRQMENVTSWIEIEQNRVSEENSELGAMAEMVIDYGNKTAEITEEIADIQSDMTFASGMAQAASTAIGGGAFDTVFSQGGNLLAASVQAANAVYQREMQQKIGEKQAEMVKLNAEKEAQFIYSDSRINDINSQARVKTRYLELRTLDIDLINAQIRLGQELDRLAQYYSDIESIIMRSNRAEKRVTQRHFADPTYRIEVLDAVLKADVIFRKAQAEIYLTARSLEYKFPLSPEPQVNYETIINGIIQSRTADDLIEQMDLMTSYNFSLDYLPGKQAFFWNYSLRKEYLKMTDDIVLANGETLSAVENFQLWLETLKNDAENLVDLDNNGRFDHLSVPFSTVKFDIDSGEFTSQTIRDSEGVSQTMEGKPIFDSRLWDDKIDLVHVNIVGNGVYTDPNIMPVELLYGGSGFIRTQGTMDTETGTLDFKTYTNINWTIDLRDGGFGWKQEEYRPQAMSAKLTANPRDIPQDVITTKNFRELPVAATGWRLLIPLDGTNFDQIRDIEIIIVHKARTKPYN